MGRAHVKADDILDLLGEGGVLGALEGAPAGGWAMARPAQWVTSPGGSAQVSARTLATMAVGVGGFPGLRLPSRKSLSTPPSA